MSDKRYYSDDSRHWLDPNCKGPWDNHPLVGVAIFVLPALAGLAAFLWEVTHV